jgi:hypothetical protein
MNRSLNFKQHPEAETAKIPKLNPQFKVLKPKMNKNVHKNWIELPKLEPIEKPRS